MCVECESERLESERCEVGFLKCVMEETIKEGGGGGRRRRADVEPKTSISYRDMGN